MIILSRKIISASISGGIFAILFGVSMPLFDDTISSVPEYVSTVTLGIPAYLQYSFPAILVYGVVTSLISDKISFSLSKNKQSESVFSFLFHMVFGLILLLYSLVASFLFYITDRILMKKQADYRPLQALKSLAIPCGVWLFFMSISYIESLFTGV